MNTKQELRQVIIKAVPSLNLCPNKDCDNGHLPLSMNEDGSMEWGGCDTCIDNGVYRPPIRDIQLADVLVAASKYQFALAVDTGGTFYNMLKGGGYRRNPEDNVIWWDLSKDLDSQSTETITFLHELLIKKS